MSKLHYRRARFRGRVLSACRPVRSVSVVGFRYLAVIPIVGFRFASEQKVEINHEMPSVVPEELPELGIGGVAVYL